LIPRPLIEYALAANFFLIHGLHEPFVPPFLSIENRMTRIGVNTQVVYGWNLVKITEIQNMAMLDLTESIKMGLQRIAGDVFLQKNKKFPTTKSEISYS
jgi:hypothetical protein